MDQLAWLFAQSPFDALDQAGRDEVSASAEITYLPSGTYVGRSGDDLDSVWVVRRGAVRRHQPGPDVVVEEGELIGVREALDGLPLAHDHEVIEDALAYLIPAPSFRALAERHGIRQVLDHRSGPTTTGLTATAGTVAGPAHHIDASASVGDAARAMETAGVDALLVDRPDSVAPGIITTRDLRSRVLARNRGSDTPVAEVATFELLTLTPDTPLAEALVFLVEHDIHHVPLTTASNARSDRTLKDTQPGASIEDPDGPGGREVHYRQLLSNDDILAHYGNDAFSLLRRRDAGTDAPGRFAEDVTRAVRGLVAADVGPGSIGRAVSSLVDGLMRSLAMAAEDELGPPPAPYALCACGSQGRREQTLLTDQDNFLVHDGDPDDPWFGQLAARVVEGMIAAGIPACDGGYMATNWCGNLEWWRSEIASRAASPGPQALLDLNIQGDLRVVTGTLPAIELWRPLHQAMDHSLLIGRLGAEVMRFRPPSRFSRFFGRSEEFDIKKHGLIPIVGLGRLLALELGLTVASTVPRLEAAAEADLVSEEARIWLCDGLDFLTGLRLRGQLRSLDATGSASAMPLRRDDLDPVERTTLRELLRVVSDVQHATSDRLGLDAVG